MERQFVLGVRVGGADVVFVGVHEASRNVVVHHPRLNCRLLYPLIDLCFVLCVVVGWMYVGGCWFALRIMWACASGGGCYSGVVVSFHHTELYASG